MTAISLLCEIIGSRGKVGTSVYRDHPDLASLSQYGLLREAGVLASVVCEECSNPHSAAVDFQHGGYGYFCPDLGFVKLERSDIQAAQADVASLVGKLADALTCYRRKTSPVCGDTWRVGIVSTHDGELALYFHPCLREERDARAVEQALTREVRSQWRLIVTADGTLPIKGSEVVRLDELVRLDKETGAFEVLAQPADLAGVPRRRVGGAPNLFKDRVVNVANRRKNSGEAMAGRNEEANAIRRTLSDEEPREALPSLATIKRYLTEVRKTGS